MSKFLDDNEIEEIINIFSMKDEKNILLSSISFQKEKKIKDITNNKNKKKNKVEKSNKVKKENIVENIQKCKTSQTIYEILYEFGSYFYNTDEKIDDELIKKVQTLITNKYSVEDLKSILKFISEQ